MSVYQIALKNRDSFFPKQRVGLFTIQHNKDNVSVKGKDQAGSPPIIKTEVSYGWGFLAVTKHPPGLLRAALGELGKARGTNKEMMFMVPFVQ